jgi:hypothetical protein
MPTTTKMGIVYPSSTDLVKDGATAMGTISTTVDAKTGLVLLNSTSFSAVTSVSFPNNTFTANFDMYKIIVEITNCSATDYLTARLRAAGSDNTTSNYSSNLFSMSHTTSAASNNGGGISQTSFNRFGYVSSGSKLFLDVVLFNPFKSSQTSYATRGTPIVNDETWILGGRFNATTSFDSLTVIPVSGNITGNIYAYGIND